MKRKLLFAAFGFTLFTFLGHTSSLFFSIPPEQTEKIRVFSEMQSAVVTMPIGSAKSFADILLGANISLSIYLLVAAVLIFLTAKTVEIPKSFVWIQSLGLFGVGIVSGIFFFPVPAVCLTVAAVLSFASTFSRN